jgi:iron complex outermembrane receptor protein
MVLAIAAAYLPPAMAEETTTLETVTVSAYGRGEIRQVEAISINELKELPAGGSPLLAVSRLPSVNFQSSDAFGAYEWSTRITLRGFAQNQLGFTLDGVPLGDMSYGNHNGLHISRAISTENIKSSVVSQGTGTLGTASTSNLGGTIEFFSIDPAKKFGGTAGLSFGSESMHRVFGRIESGDTGVGRFFVSVADQKSEKFKGTGERKQQQVNSKYVFETDNLKFSAFANASKRRETDDQDLSYDIIHRLGYNADNFYPNITAAINAANTLCGNGTSTYVTQCDDAYYFGSGLRDDQLYGATLAARLNSLTDLSVTAYRHHNKGAGLWVTPYTPSPDGTPISTRTTEYGISRNGILGSLAFNIGSNELKGGFWLEENNFNQARRFYAVNPASPPSPLEFPSNPFFTQWQYQFKTDTTQFFLQDTAHLTDALTLSAGFKSMKVKNHADLLVGDPTTRPAGDITAEKNFLPQAGLNFKLDDTNELFAAYAQNMRGFAAAATGLSPYSTTLAGFNGIKSTLKPETSNTLEGGWRFAAPAYEGVVSAYFVDFKDRLLAAQPGTGIQGNPTVLTNVGHARMTGVEAALSLKLSKEISWYNGVSFNKSEYKDNYVTGGTTVAISGKQMVDVPESMLKSTLGYTMGSWSSSLGLEYTGKRYFTYSNDQSVPATTLLNASVTYDAGRVAFLSDLSLQFNVTNLTDKQYLSTIGSNGFGVSGDNQTLLTGAPRQFYMTLTGKF